MKCPDCGTYNAHDAERCHKCGSAFLSPDPTPPTISPFVKALLCIFIIFLFVMIYADHFTRDTPSPVARVKGDHRTMTIALETYYLDHNAYPACSIDRTQNAFDSGLRDKKNLLQKIPTFRVSHDGKFATLTTPASYISSYFSDPFAPVKGASFAYWNPSDETTTHGTGYLVWSAGPDGDYDITIENVARIYTPLLGSPNPAMLEVTYDPSNGTESNGDVYRYKQ